MFFNETNIVEKMKFKKANISRLTYLGVGFLWILGFYLIKWAETDGQAFVYYILGLAFSGITFITALVIQNDKDKTLSFFKFGLLGYVLYVILCEVLIIAARKGNDESLTNLISQIAMSSRIVTPIGMIGWQAKKWTFLTGINKNKRDTIDHLTKHGNDGMN